MITHFKIFWEAVVMAMQQLTGNKLRSFLSLLGISIGIFCIIGILSAVDSLKDYIQNNLNKLGNDVVYVQKWPFVDMGGNWWDWIKRPYPDYEEFEAVKTKSQTADLVSFHLDVGVKTAKYQSNSVDRVFLAACTVEFASIFNMDIEQGRFFTASEAQFGSNVIILGANVAEALFGNIDPLGKDIKMVGKKFRVIGVIKKEGEDPFNPLNFDDSAFISVNSARSFISLKSNQFWNSSISVKAREGMDVRMVKDELTSIVRAHRRLKPKQEDNFALNEISMIASVLGSFFGTLNILGFVIGFFALLVGGVSVANIMFVSVKERTAIIGIKKSIGAKREAILLEFLIEAVVLCMVGGVIGLGLIFVILTALTYALDFELHLSMTNIALGLAASIFVGVVSGFVPALQASNLDPVEAMRRK